jgi:hypothetical protein
MTDDSVRARRSFLGGALIAGAAVLCTGRPGPAQSKDHPAQPKDLLAQAKKYTKERVGYRDEPYEGRTCAKCVLYVGHGECAIVQGEISADGWCVQWTPATMGSWAGPA